MRPLKRCSSCRSRGEGSCASRLRWRAPREGDPPVIGTEDWRAFDARHLKRFAAGTIHAQEPDVALATTTAATSSAATSRRSFRRPARRSPRRAECQQFSVRTPARSRRVKRRRGQPCCRRAAIGGRDPQFTVMMVLRFDDGVAHEDHPAPIGRDGGSAGSLDAVVVGELDGTTSRECRGTQKKAGKLSHARDYIDTNVNLPRHLLTRAEKRWANDKLKFAIPAWTIQCASCPSGVPGHCSLRRAALCSAACRPG